MDSSGPEMANCIGYVYDDDDSSEELIKFIIGKSIKMAILMAPIKLRSASSMSTQL